MFQNIQDAAKSTKNPHVASLMNMILEYNNVPRKKAKFEVSIYNTVGYCGGMESCNFFHVHESYRIHMYVHDVHFILTGN